MKDSLLFGNGLNLLGDNPISWDLLLDKLDVGDEKVNKDAPNTMRYEKIFLDRSVDKLSELDIKNQISTLMKEQECNKHYDEIIKLGFDNYS